MKTGLGGLTSVCDQWRPLWPFLSSHCLPCGRRERCGMIKIRQPGAQRHRRERELVFQNGPAGGRRLTRKRYIDLGKETRLWSFLSLKHGETV